MKHESATETYLRRATRGLWGRRRREVREELEAHLLERALAHRIAGLGEADAVERALSELGRPQEVSVGMARLYTLPTVMGSSLAAAGVCLAVMALWPKGLAQPAVEASFYWPTQACVKAQQMDALYGACEEFSTLWLEPSSFKAEMRRQGVVVDEGRSLTMTFPNGAFVRLPTEPSEMMLGSMPIQTQPGAIAFTDLLQELLNQPGSLWFEGWDNPVAHIGKVVFQLGTTTHRVMGEKFYENVLESIFFKTLSATLKRSETTAFYILNPRQDLTRTSFLTEIKVKQPGVYGVVTSVSRELVSSPWLLPTKSDDVLTAFEVVRSGESETLAVMLPENTKFVTSFSSRGKANTAILVQFADSPSTDIKGYSSTSTHH